MQYKQLTREQRYIIQLELNEGKAIAEIAKKIGVHRSTLYREIKRNSSASKSYCFESAETESLERRSRSWRKYKD